MTPTPTPSRPNPTERVAKCETCDGPIVAGARGPLPRRHPECRPPEAQLLYQLRTSARLARSIGNQLVGQQLDAMTVEIQLSTSWTRLGE